MAMRKATSGLGEKANIKCVDKYLCINLALKRHQTSYTRKNAPCV